MLLTRKVTPHRCPSHYSNNRLYCHISRDKVDILSNAKNKFISQGGETEIRLKIPERRTGWIERVEVHIG